jgi:predicted NBD/HSP70 family sugar kinase
LAEYGPDPHDIVSMGPQAGCGPLLSTPDRTSRPLRQQVLERIRAAGTISRSDVAKDIGISPASVTAIVTGLMAEGWIGETTGPPRDGGRGRPPVALRIEPAAAHVVGVSLRDEAVTAVVSDFAGGEVASLLLDTRPARRSVEQTVDLVAEVLGGVLERAGLQPSDIAVIGLGLPGFVLHEDGMVYWSPLLQDRHVPLGAALAARMPCPVLIDNDVNLLALAELWFGKGRELSDFAVITIEQGVGMGLVQDNAVNRGTRGLGLELGHTTMQIDGALCRCGQRGCLEAYVADYALAREATVALDWTNRAIPSTGQMIEILFDQAKAGNEEARMIFRRAGRFLSAGLANMIRLFDPELVILSGARLRYDYLYAEELLAEIHRFSDRLGRPRTRIEIHTWGDLVWARGGAALALSAVTAVTADRAMATGSA